MRSLVALLTIAGILLPMDAVAQTIPLVTSSPMANGDTESVSYTHLTLPTK